MLSRNNIALSPNICHKYLMNQKGNSALYVIFGILLLVLVGGGAYYLGAIKNQVSQSAVPSVTPGQSNQTNTPLVSPTGIPGWDTFDGIGYSLNYPSNWTVSKMLYSNEIYDPSSVVKGGNGGGVVSYTSSLLFSASPYIKTVQEYVNGIKESQISPKELASAFSEKDITLNSLKGIEYTLGGEGSVGTYLAFTNGKYLVNFGPLDSYPSSIAIVNQILSTFKFTD